VVDLDSQLAEMIALRDAGKIGASASATSASRSCVRPFRPHRLRAEPVQRPQPRHEDVLTECADQGVAWVPFFPLGSAFDRLPHVTTTRWSPCTPSVSASPRLRPGWPGCSGTARPRYLIPGTRDLAHLADKHRRCPDRTGQEAMTAFDALAQTRPLNGMRPEKAPRNDVFASRPDETP